MLGRVSRDLTSINELNDELAEIIQEQKKCCQNGEVANYIPELGKANPDHLAVSICSLKGEMVEAGDTEVPFTMQSISKVITLAFALMDNGEDVVFDKVGMEPTGDPFNSIVKLETSKPNKPLNPMINAGAIAVTSLIKGNSVDERLGRLLQFVHELCGNASITYNPEVARSESETANLNRSLSYFLREHNVIQGSVEEILELYFKQCAIEVRCRDLAQIGAVFANEGKDIKSGRQIIPTQVARICKSFMLTCGMYNASGEFAIRVGVPAKSGVSGGILVAIPFQMGIAVYGPALDSKGNSVGGVSILETITKRWQLSIF
jgi:glutaminase